MLTKTSRFRVFLICKKYKDTYIIRYNMAETPKPLFACRRFVPFLPLHPPATPGRATLDGVEPVKG